ncbi:hypothetical protein [Marinobacter zhanjiangensis]|uniref:Uncharacterized protein n=1 Tax=Marinobacter zhanjiangensis TaxID=578215 RepID=A0ABQ3B2V1_9GAMM|nr:hypothetical protein [Marinobacter zhanjiangensis]GGY76266.1 hypothetical protein GCM10007071_24610 [Marinobacter zhanjiangensis]
MRGTKTILSLALMAFTGTAFSDDAYHAYFMDTFAAYGESVERCQALRDDAGAPPQELVEEIKGKDSHHLRVFLIYHEFARQDECTAEETAAMLYALGALPKVDDVPPETRQAVEALSENMFSGERLEMEMRYRDLPSGFREKLEAESWFHTPFSAFEVLEAAEAAD